MQGINELNPTVSPGDDPPARESAEADNVAQTLNQTIATLQAKLKEAEATIRRQENEIRNLTANVDVLVGQIRKLAQCAKPTAADAGMHAAHVEWTPENSDGKRTTLEGQEAKIQETLRHKESTIEALEQRFSIKLRDFETQLSNKEKLLVERDKRVNDLELELATVINRMKEISSSLRQAEALASLQRGIGAAAAGQTNGDAESLSAAQSNGPNHATGDRGMVPIGLFDRMARELTSIMGPLAPAIIHYDVIALCESMDAFPRRRLLELLDTVTREMTDESLKRTFREKFIKT